MKRKTTRNLLTGKTADVAVSRGGLTITIESVAAADAAKVAKAILDAFRGLVTAGYDELREVGPSLHGGGVDVPEDADIEPVTLPPESREPRTIGFGYERPAGLVPARGCGIVPPIGGDTP